MNKKLSQAIDLLGTVIIVSMLTYVTFCVVVMLLIARGGAQ